MVDPVEFGRQMAQIVREALAPVEERLKALEGRDLVRDLLDTDKVETLVSLAVAEYLTENPPPAGKDGEDGKPGRDGLDVKDMFRADGGRLVAVMSDGTTRDLGQFVGKDGEDGKDGKDGLGFEDSELTLQDGEAVLRLIRGERVKELRIPLPTMKHIGFWQAGMSAKAGEQTTHDGCSWLALRDTKSTPSYDSPDWQMTARKGVDGKKGRDFRPPEPVKLGGGKDE